MKELKMYLEIYLQILRQEDKEFREKYKKVKPGNQGFAYDPEKWKKLSTEERLIRRNKSEQKLHINRLLKLMNQVEKLESEMK